MSTATEERVEMKLGTVLDNGATVIAHAPWPGLTDNPDQDWLVLAFWGNEYVTWRVVNLSGKTEAMWGNYWQDDLLAAAVDFQYRKKDPRVAGINSDDFKKPLNEWTWEE